MRTLLSCRDANDPIIARRDVRAILVHSRRKQGPEFWTSLTDEAEYHGVAPLLEPIISAFARDDPETVPDDVRWAFVALAHRHRRAALAREACVDNLLEAFATVGIPVILLKGAALSHLIYSAPKLRPMVDVDLLINPADVERAVILSAILATLSPPVMARALQVVSIIFRWPRSWPSDFGSRWRSMSMLSRQTRPEV